MSAEPLSFPNPDEPAPRRFRLAKRYKRLTLTGDYEGCWAIMLLNPPMSTLELMRTDALAASGLLVKEWNLDDDKGKPLPANEEGMRALDDDLWSALIAAWREARDLSKSG